MHRRGFIAAVGVGAVAGCTEHFGGEDGTTVRGDELFGVPADEDQVLEIVITNHGEGEAAVTVYDPDGDVYLEESVADQETLPVDSGISGQYEIEVVAEEARVQFFLEEA